MRQATITIDKQALRKNFNRVKTLAPHSKVVSMVKANAYGHDIKACLSALSETDAFGVACLDEAIQIRKLGYTQDITLIEGVFDEAELINAIEYNCECLVHHQTQVEWLKKHHTSYQKKNLKVWVKLNSGMNRLGFKPDEIVSIIKELKSLGFTCILTMHFANADTEHDLNQQQKQLFLDIKKQCAPILASCCNSAALFKWQDLHFDYVRPGVMLYGASPFSDRTINELGLTPVMDFSAEVIALNTIQIGEKVGYGSSFIAPHSMKIAVVGVGYGDGYPRAYQQQNYVYINNTLAPLIGRVSMDMMAIDVTDLPTCIGDKVELWGKHRLVDDVAVTNGTIGYELLCRLTTRPHRI